jgi:hypothetical protein
MHDAIGGLCLLAALAFGCRIPAADAASEPEILPIQFAELIDQEDATVEVLEIPSVVIRDEAAGETVGPIEEIPAGSVVPQTIVEHPVVDVSSRAADGLRIDDFSLDEMPYEASSGTWFSNGRWYGSAEMLWFDRSRNYRRVLGHDATVTLPNGPNLAGTLTTTGIPWGIAPGARITLGEYVGRDYLDRDQSLEMTYYGGLAFFQKDGWNALPGSFLVTPLSKFEPPGFVGAQFYGTSHNSIFNSMEWNYKLHRRLGRDQLVMSPNGNWSRHAERAW